jgi:hypothetical protein
VNHLKKVTEQYPEDVEAWIGKRARTCTVGWWIYVARFIDGFALICLLLHFGG